MKTTSFEMVFIIRETGDRFVTDYELMVFAKILGVSVEWLIGQEEKSK